MQTYTLLLYRLLAGATAAVCILFGVVFVCAFLDRAVFQIFVRPLFDTDIQGYFILGFAGCALFAWAGCLIASARAPRDVAGVATATATALVVTALLRLLAWYSGEYWPTRDLLRAEAATLAVVALAFIWLKPDRRTA